MSVFHFWAIPHTQLYTECARLAEAGLLDEHREESGRRRRVYRLTAEGRTALEEWRADPDADLYELRDPGLLKLFCGADPPLWPRPSSRATSAPAPPTRSFCARATCRTGCGSRSRPGSATSASTSASGHASARASNKKR